MIRAVLDTSILVRSVLRPLASMGFIARGLGEGRFVAVYSDVMLDELTEVLGRPRLRNKYGVRDEDVLALVGAFLQYGEAVEPQQTLTVCRDPKDDKFLETAVAGRADVIVTADEDLLVLDPFEGIAIVKPAAFEKMVIEHEMRR